VLRARQQVRPADEFGTDVARVEDDIEQGGRR
jgi:hypothetical protein